MNKEYYKVIVLILKHFESKEKQPYRELNHIESIANAVNLNYLHKYFAVPFEYNNCPLSHPKQKGELQGEKSRLDEMFSQEFLVYLAFDSQQKHLHENYFLQIQLCPFSIHQINKSNHFLKHLWASLFQKGLILSKDIFDTPTGMPSFSLLYLLEGSN